MEFQETAPLAHQALESEGRRRFVAQAGMVTVSMALGGSGLASAAVPQPLNAWPQGPGRALRVGLLLPDASPYPLLGAQLLAGARAFAAQPGSSPLQFTPVVYGSRPSQAEPVVAHLLASGQVDLLAGFVCANTAAQWEPLLAAHQVPLLVGDAGANALAPQARSEWVVRNSLGYWQAAWAAGRWAAKALGPRALVAVGPADSGFDQLPAFERGFASAGGRVQATMFTSAPDGTSRLDALARQVRQTRPDFVYALASGAGTSAFRQFWNTSAMASQVPLVAAGMLAEDMAAFSLAGQVWAARASQVPPGNPATAAPGVSGSTPFHLLGYEMAQRMHAAALTSSGRAGGLALAAGMASAVLQTPRGRIHLDPATGETVAPIYLHGLHQGPGAAPMALPTVGAAACLGVCETLTSRVAGTYLTA